MKKLVKIELSAVISLLVILLVYNLIMKKTEALPISSYVTSETEGLAYMDFTNPEYIEASKYMKNYNDQYLEQLKSLYTQEEYDVMKKSSELYYEMQNQINDILLLSEKTDYKNLKDYKNIKSVLVVNFKNSFLKLYIKTHLKKIDGDLYELRDKKDIVTFLRQLNVMISKLNESGDPITEEEIKAAVDKVDIYVKEIDGRYIFSVNKNYLENYTLRVNSKDSEVELASKFDQLKKEKFNLFLFDMKSIMGRYKEEFSKITESNPYIEEIDYVYFNSNYKNNNASGNISVEGKGKIFSLLDSSSLKERNLVPYVNGAISVYFANNSFRDFFNEINDEIMKLKGTNYATLLTMFLKRDPYQFIDNLGDELVVNINSLDKFEDAFSIVLNTKEEQPVKDFLSEMNIHEVDGKYVSNDMSLVLKNHKLFFNKEEEKHENKIDTKNLSLYVKIDFDKISDKLGSLSPSFNEFEELEIKYMKPEIYLYGENQKLSLKMIYNYDEMMKLMMELAKSKGKL